MRKIIAVLLVLMMCVNTLVMFAGDMGGEEVRNRQGGPYYHQIYSATSTNGINWTVNTTLLFDHASVPGSVYFNNKLYLYYVNAADPENEKLSVGVSTDKGATFTVYDVHITGANSPYPVDPNPIVDGNKIRLTYLGNFMQSETNKIVTATSSDGTDFTEDGVIFTENVFDPDLFYDDVSGEWVLFVSSGTSLTKATSSSPTATFTKDTSFSWDAGGISSTHKIGSKYYTYYAGMNGISVAEYSYGTLSNIADGIASFQGMGADPTVAVFEANDYKMFFKVMVGGGTPEEQITVNFTGSTYKSVTEKPSGWFSSGQNADIMLSGIDFNNTGGPLLFNHPTGIASDGTHLLLADTWNNRVLIWNSLPTGNVTPNIVLGQENFYSNNPGRGLNQMNWPMGVSTDGQRVVVADTCNDRILIWNTFPTYNGQPANLVIEGDPAATYPTRRIDWPWGIWTNGVKIVVSSTSTASVLIWNTFPTQTNQSADIYLTGQGQIGTPRNIVSDGTRLIVGDHNPNVPGATGQGNFFWSSFPTTNDQMPTFFMSDPGCPGGAWMRGEFTQDGKLVLLGVGLYIWNTFPASNTTSPDLTVGVWWPEPGGSKYWFHPAEGAGLTLVGSKLYTTSNNVIIGFNSLPTTGDAHPDFAVGGPDAYTSTLETNYIIQNPVPATDGTSLFVSSDAQKLYVWKNLPDESSAKPDIVYTLPFAPWDSAIFGNTFVLAGKDYVYIWNELPLDGELPDERFKGSIGDVTFKELMGVELDDKYFYLADRDANKIYIWEGIPNQTTNPKFSLDVQVPTGLSSDGTYLVVAATEAANSTERVMFYRIEQLSPTVQPTFLAGINVNTPAAGIAVGGRLFLADTGFNRVLVWNSISDAVNGAFPDIVLGEKDFNDTLAEIGINKLFMPAALTFDGSYLWAGEFKFSGRVVRFSVKAIPHEPIYIDSNDDFVIGQNGVVSGNGTQANPYIIEGWDINASSANGISIGNTTVYFTIRNCVVHDGKSNSKYGCYFDNVQNGKINNVTVYKNSYGIYLSSSSYNTITNCTVYNNTNGIHIYVIGENNTTIIKSNTIKFNDIGISGETDVGSGELADILIADNTITNNNKSDAPLDAHGIYLHSFGYSGVYYMHNVTITGNTISSNGGAGIYLSACSPHSPDPICYAYIKDVIITGNIVSSNGGPGVYLYTYYAIASYSQYHSNIYNVTITHNTISSNSDSGIYLYASPDGSRPPNYYSYISKVNITCNTVSSNDNFGIYLSSSATTSATSKSYIYNVNITSNTVSSNGASGVYLSSYASASDSHSYIYEVNITGNTVSSNGDSGIYLYIYASSYNTYCNYNNITSNHIYNNYLSGINLNASSNNSIYNNYFNNTNNAYSSSGSSNRWNITKTPGTNIVKGDYLGGNYWSDYMGADTDGDDIGDTPYTIPGGSGEQDNLPLVKVLYAVDYIQIRTMPNGGGSIVTSKSYSLAETDTFYAASYNLTVGYIGDVFANWTCSNPSVGVISPGPGTSTTFTAISYGTCVVTASYAGKSNSTGTLTVPHPGMDMKPQMSNVSAIPNPQEVGSHVNITCIVTDDVAVNIVKVNITYPNGTTKNITMMKVGTNSYSYNTSYSVLGNYSYYIWANDTSNNQNKSGTYQFNIIALGHGVEVSVTYIGTGTINVTSAVLPQVPPENLESIGIQINVTITGELTYANITIKYRDSDVAGVDETKLRMYYWTGAEWKVCDNTGVDTVNNIVWANVTHLTIFVPMAEKVDTTKPVISNVQANPPTQTQGGAVNITCTVTDDIGISTVKVSITGPTDFAPVNITMAKIAGANNYYYNTNYSVIGNYSYYIWANDTSGNGNESTTYQFTITLAPGPPPENLAYIGIFVDINIPGNMTVAFITINYNDSDVLSVDESTLKLYYWSGTVWVVVEDSGVWLNNNTVWARVTHGGIFVPMAEKVDTTNPVISNVQAAPSTQTQGGYVNITCIVTDNIGISTVKVSITGPTGFTAINTTMIKITGTNNYYYNSPYTIAGTYSYYIWANDTSNNQIISTVGTFEISTSNLAPAAVTLNSPTDITSATMLLSWSQNTDSDFANYTIYQSTTSGNIGTAINTTTTQSTTYYTVTGLSQSTTYYFTVRVYDTGGLHNDSNQVSGATLAAVTTGSLTGTVTDKNSKPIEGATVSVVGTSYVTWTDSNGRYTFSGVTASSYQVRVEKSGYKTKTETGIVINAGGTTTLDIVLEEEKKEEPKGFIPGFEAVTIIIALGVVMLLRRKLL